MSDEIFWSHHFRSFPPPRVCNKNIGLTDAKLQEFRQEVAAEVEVERAFNRAPMRLMQGVVLEARITFYLPGDKERHDIASMAKTVLEALDGVLFSDVDQVADLSLLKRCAPTEEYRGTFSLGIREA